MASNLEAIPSNLLAMASNLCFLGDCLQGTNALSEPKPAWASGVLVFRIVGIRVSESRPRISSLEEALGLNVRWL